MKNTNAVRNEIHYAQVGEYQLPLLTLPQTDDTEPLGKGVDLQPFPELLPYLCFHLVKIRGFVRLP